MVPMHRLLYMLHVFVSKGTEGNKKLRNYGGRACVMVDDQKDKARYFATVIKSVTKPIGLAALIVGS